MAQWLIHVPLLGREDGSVHLDCFPFLRPVTERPTPQEVGTGSGPQLPSPGWVMRQCVLAV